jgi:SAM-dependent methyltransferase
MKAFLSNQLARFTPGFYVNLTHQTGRGSAEESPSQVAEYFIRCFNDYREQLGQNKAEFNEYLKQKRVLEYGPGDTLGVALLFYAHGSELVHCVDRFPLQKLSEKSLKVYQVILESLGRIERERACAAFVVNGKPETGFNTDAINYFITKDGLSGENSKYDLIISRAVLEHVNNLEKTFYDIARALKKDGLSIHLVDLKSHGLDRYQPFDFLTWPSLLYQLMFSEKGFPNRWRINKYQRISQQS